MKISKLLLLSVAVIFLSCGDDDDDPKPTSQGIVGTWAIAAVDYKGTTTTTVQGSTIKADFTGTGKDMNLTTTFNANPNTVSSQGSYIIVLKTSILGQTTTDEYPFDDVVSDGTWELNGDKLKVTNSGVTQEATIVEQTSTSLKIKVDVNESETSQGYTIATNIQATYTFKKQ
jgi:hypothetical protein